MEKYTGGKIRVDGIPGILVQYSDGSIEREPPSTQPIAAHKDFVDGVATEDVCINPSTGTWARIFFPQAALTSNITKLPLVLHFHGGGMVTGSPSDAMHNAYCSRMCARSRSVWVSVAYRLAPEQRLPAQYEDCLQSLTWLQEQFAKANPTPWIPVDGLNDTDGTKALLREKQEQPWWDQRHFALPEEQLNGSPVTEGLLKEEPWRNKDAFLLDCPHPWLAGYGDPSKVFCTGESCGSTILHYVGLRISQKNWSPLRICGLVFVDVGVLADPLPEMKPWMDTFLTPALMSACTRFSLPSGSKLGDPLLDCLHPALPKLSERPFPPALILAADRDYLYQNSIEYFKALKEGGNDASLHVTEGEGHCFNLVRPDTHLAEARESKLVEFVQKF